MAVALYIGFLLGKSRGAREGFDAGGATVAPSCGACGGQMPCPCPNPRPICPAIDYSKYVLKSTIPPCPPVPDMSQYIKKSEVPPCPDLSNYVAKSSIPPTQPVILDCSKCHKPKGECPPCPRPRCPDVQCPPPTKCPPCPQCPRTRCPPAVVKCKAEEVVGSGARPFLAPLNFDTFGQ